MNIKPVYTRSCLLMTLFFTALSFHCYSQYLPLTGGTLTGNLTLNAGIQLQTPYLGFNTFFTQPSNSSNFALFPNSSSGTLDIVGAGWRFIPANNSSYQSPVVSFDASGNTNIMGNTYIGKNLGIGTTAPIQQLNINQLAGSAKGLLFSGDEYFVSGNNSGNGILMLLGVNRTGNHQLWIGDNTSLGSPTSGFLRYMMGSGMPTIDCVSGDGNNILPFNLGDSFSNIGIGFATAQLPASKITINGNLAIGNGYLTNAAPANGAIIQGNVLIGKTSQTNTGYILDVAGNVRVNQIVVNTTGADFVFSPSYRLHSLSFLKKYIDQNHHLPEIPSAKQMQAKGLNVGDNQVRLLQKVEELTLYLIEKDNELKDEQAKNLNQETKLNAQQEQINEMKQQMESILKQLKK